LPVRALFQAPTVAQLAALLASRPTDPPTLIAGRPGAEQGHIPRRLDDGPCPLSFAQQRLWFLHQLAPESPLHNLAFAVRLQGPLDRPTLQQALDALVDRHHALRTTFAFHDGAPVQLIAPPRPAPLAVLDLQTEPPATRDSALQHHLADQARRLFDLTQDLLLRAVIVHLAPDEGVLLLVTHHIAADGWSLGILFDELAALYEAFAHGHPSPLPPLPLQYADYAVWQRQVLTGPALAAQRAYWTQQLAGAPTLLELPADRPRPAVQSYRGAQLSFTLPTPLTRELNALSRREDVTVFMALLAAFQTLLHRLSGQTDIVVASPIAGRIRRELEPLVGVFVNTLALRTSLADDPSFRTLLARVRHVTLGAFDHPELPFELLVEELHPQRSLGHAPLAQVMFVLQNTAPVSLSLPGLTATPVATDTGASEFDLALFLRDTPDGLRGVWQYNSDLFDAPTIARLAGHFRTLLHGIVAAPDQPLSVLPLLTAAERHQLLVEWNATQADYPHDLCLHHLVEAQVARTPDAVALVFNDQSLTYRQLNARANQLAHHLQGLGVGPEVLVGVCLERSPDLVIALLGILKAGAAYLPLDPAYPRQRLAFMLEDAQVPVVLTHQPLRPGLPACAARVVCLDTEGAAIGALPTTNPASPVRPDQLAYVIYTSGSTGQPKGVLGLHRGTLNRFHWMYDRYPFAPDDVCCQKTSVNFVDSVWEIFGPLAHGVPLVIIPDAVLQDPAQLVETLAARRVTRLLLVPSLLRMILETDLDLHRRLPHLRWWISSGEALSLDLVQQFRQRLPHRTLLNLYGSSEASADSTFHEIPHDEPLTTVPIGRPIANTQLYVLDAHQHPVPIGVPGELYIGGVGLARGYLNRPALTAETFVPHLFGDEAGARLYKTGDRVRYRPDGALLYLGRLDQQVKLRGVRIELGELEAALAQHPSVQHAVVALRDDPAGDPCLVAYLVAHPTTALAAADLRDHLRQKLPGYMLPAAFVPLAALPLTPSGKVDRTALPPPSAALPGPDTSPLPRTPMERLIARIWCEALALDTVTVDDSFFDLGGHSLLAIQILQTIEQATGIKGQPTALFVRTLGQLASDYDERQTAGWRPLKAGLLRRLMARIRGDRRGA
jgi:amino acid adenylation domain-containing protein